MNWIGFVEWRRLFDSCLVSHDSFLDYPFDPSFTKFGSLDVHILQVAQLANSSPFEEKNSKIDNTGIFKESKISHWVSVSI